MNDWEVGDIALCVRDVPEGGVEALPVKAGQIKEVSRVAIVEGYCLATGVRIKGLYLSFTDLHRNHGYADEYFTKIRPLTYEEITDFVLENETDSSLTASRY